MHLGALNPYFTIYFVLHGSTVISNPIESNSNTGGAGGSSGTNTGGNNNSGGTTNTNTGASGGGGGGGSQLDTTPPVIIVNGNNSVSVNTGTTYVDQGATASDNVDTTVSVVVTGNVNTSVAGTYYITYTATDSSGNITTTVRTVNVINSQVRTTPVINLTGNTNEIITVNSNYTDPGATALGINDEVLSVTTSGTVNTSVPGTYTISYTTTDAYGNTGVALRELLGITTILGSLQGKEDGFIINLFPIFCRVRSI